MGSLKGVGDVAFDCKTATIRMAGAATLDAATVEKAITGAGFKMGEFTAAARPTFAVVATTLKKLAAEDAAGAASGAAGGTVVPEPRSVTLLEQELPHELPALTGLFVEADGRATLLLREGAALDVNALDGALARRGLAADGYATTRWPTSATSRIAVVKGIDAAGAEPKVEAAAHAKARAAIAGIENVLAAIARRDGLSFVVFTREPCAKLEARLAEALRAAGLELSRVE